ncbi:MAG: twitching motility protein PilT [Lachnospiraceae bacterium]|nr:twitching motility protein PilT [Lachnospiraceae bacterium]
MIQIITGEKGKGKTKILLDKVAFDVQNAKGSIVYLDKNNKHMYELDRSIRLMNMNDYFVENADEFIGFVMGVLSQNTDIEKIYFDSFLTVSFADSSNISALVNKLDKISANFKADFVISISASKDTLPLDVQEFVTVAL